MANRDGWESELPGTPDSPHHGARGAVILVRLGQWSYRSTRTSFWSRLRWRQGTDDTLYPARLSGPFRRKKLPQVWGTRVTSLASEV